MNKLDLTVYGEQELSLQVFNDEYLYNQRHKRGFKNILDEFFIYTDEQLEEIEKDLLDELTEDEEGFSIRV